ncbi:hypothetical protein QFC22_006198 [Naganishia vaughanmartiniae]|uniref:Uncharacterized protein n=1 Tax=Naganishia vaughanmartiniae TaxID=1424756 RepID=A0ACC2WNM7_9TREE|nr:hypothetical protein QFC22_006198 [Naganishia vaughanmartiniae]
MAAKRKRESAFQDFIRGDRFRPYTRSGSLFDLWRAHTCFTPLPTLILPLPLLSSSGEFKSVLPKNEPLTPGILYIGVAGLAGSVLARNRNILVRLLLPPTLLVASSPYFLPQTSANVRAYLSQVEDTHFPELAATHRAVNAQLGETFSTALDKVQHVSQEAGVVGSKVVRGVEETTGLRLGEALGRARETAEDAVKEFSHVTAEKRAQHAASAVAVPEKTRVVGVVYEEIPVATLIAPVDRVEEVREDLKQGTLPIVGVKEEKRLV